MKEKFETELIQFVNKRKEQKLRGLNNYNIMTAIRHANAEVGMHSNFIYSLINIDGEHYQGSLFADLFVKNVLGIYDFGKITEVVMEDDADGRRIDFVIKSDKYSIGIEMKTRTETKDQPSQIYDYYIELMKDNKGKKNTIIYYLTLNGKEPSEESCCSRDTRDKIYKDYKNISFENEILLWLEKCKKQVVNITNLNNAIDCYTDVVKMITGQYCSPLNKFEDFFTKSEERFSLMKDMSKSEISEVVNGDNSLLSGKEAIQEADDIIKSFEETNKKLYDEFYKKFFEFIVKENDGLSFGDYDNTTKYKTIIFNYSDTYRINLYLNKDSSLIDTIGVAIAWKDYKNNNVKRKRLEKANNKLANTIELKEYIIGRTKGVKILQNHSLPLPTVKNLFLAQENPIEKLNNNVANSPVIKEIQNHIKVIIDGLEKQDN